MRLTGHSGPVWSLLVLNDTLIASGSEDCMIKMWDWEYGECIRTLISHSGPIWGLSMDDEDNLATVSWYVDY